jgi:hypothetical protein
MSLSITAACLMAMAFSYAGMAGLCLAMHRHHSQVWGRDVGRVTRRVFQCLGWLLLALAIVPCVQAWGASVGTVAWLGFLSVGALVLAGLLPYAPRFAAGAAPVMAIVAALGWYLA